MRWSNSKPVIARSLTVITGWNVPWAAVCDPSIRVKAKMKKRIGLPLVLFMGRRRRRVPRCLLPKIRSAIPIAHSWSMRPL